MRSADCTVIVPRQLLMAHGCHMAGTNKTPRGLLPSHEAPTKRRNHRNKKPIVDTANHNLTSPSILRSGRHIDTMVRRVQHAASWRTCLPKGLAALRGTTRYWAEGLANMKVIRTALCPDRNRECSPFYSLLVSAPNPSTSHCVRITKEILAKIKQFCNNFDFNS